MFGSDIFMIDYKPSKTNLKWKVTDSIAKFVKLISKFSFNLKEILLIKHNLEESAETASL